MIKNTSRIHAMDTIRGLASLQVLLHHCLVVSILFWDLGMAKSTNTTYITRLIWNSPFHLLWAGHEAVTLFFVMSGFVLSIPFYAKKKVIYKEFFIKRIFRIYGPYLITISIGIVFNNIYANHERFPALSDWFITLWSKKITITEMFDFLILKGDWLNVVTSLWSLPVEIKISLFFPIIVTIIKKLNLRGGLLLIITNVIFYMVGKRLGFQVYWNDFALFYYLTFFLCGALLYKYHNVVVKKIDMLNVRSIYLLFIIALLLYTYEYNIVIFPDSILNLARIIPSDYMTLIASILFIALAISNSAPKWLMNKYLVFFGKISFSLYLIHPIIIGIVGFTFGKFIPIYIIVPACFFLSILMAIPFYRFVEAPLQNLGRKLSKRNHISKNKKNISLGRDSIM